MDKHSITICMGSSCFARGNERNLEFCEEFLEKRGLTDGVDVDLQGSLCEKCCAEGPIVVVDGRRHTRVDRAAMGEILQNLFPAEGGAR